MRPSSNLYLEDFAPGQRYETAEHLVIAADTIRFAREFDPQPFHVDPEAGARSVFGGLIAPGPYTLCISLRLFFDLNLWETAMIASPGMRDVKWLLPVRPGDRLRAVAEVTEVRRSRSKPDRGVVTMLHETRNHSDNLVFSAVCLHLIRARAG